MIIGVTGGKGGTGKSTVSTSLAYYLSQYYKVLLVDADVDCPNDHLILKSKFIRERDVNQFIPSFDMDKCTYCGLCSKNCREHAIVVVKNKLLFFPEQCNGCKTCLFVCPEKAIKAGSEVIGKIKEFRVTKNLILKSGFLNPGVEESSAVVKKLLEEVNEEKDNFDFIIIDTAAGTHCDVIKAIMNTEQILLVTEPTPLGLNDLKLISDVALKIKKEAKTKLKKDVEIHIVINKFGLSREYSGLIEHFSAEKNIIIIARVNYSKDIINKYINGEAIMHPEIRKIGDYYMSIMG